METYAPEIISKLVETFEKNLDAYRSSKNETELRREFLDKFFAALGWDVSNEKGYDEAHKEVVHEFSVEIAGQGKKADYAFRTGADKFDFLVEAKKPSVKVESSQEAAFQLRRYGWSAKLPLNILTDFEHFAVYDCRARPSISDPASAGRIMLLHYKEYAARWNEIAAVFSPEAVRKGSFAQYAEGMKGKKGTADVDDAFLGEIERWRDLLAKNIALRNPGIDVPGLNYAVQMTIDRIVFLRICEERGIEPEKQLLEIAAPPPPSLRDTSPKSRSAEFGGGREGAVYKELCHLFQRADTKYNSGLFHFKKEAGRASHPDDLTPSLEIDDKVLKDIIQNLYYPHSPYAFLYIPADILGQVYERFLGKVIRLTAGHQAKVEEKPEVRKAGGVYYTPTYIVDYIVKNTVGKLVENQTPQGVSSLKILDPACGSGTFLLGAYQFLLDWHLKWYSENDSEKWEKSQAIVRADGGWRLTTAKKKEILLNSIHGVDIDPQAVEVTKLSLLLKVLEGESGQLSLGLERALPDLGNNIKCGNSLIGFDYFEGQMFPDPEERLHVNPFDWKSEFPQAFARGGFDVVIGNPPYVRPHNIPENIKQALWKTYSTFVAKSDMYSCFMERGITITRTGGIFSFIVPHTWTSLESFTKIREFLIQNSKVTKLVQLPKKVFEDATVETCIFVIQKDPSNTHSENLISIENLTAESETLLRRFAQREIEQAYLYNFQLYGRNESQSVISKIQEKGKPLSAFVSLAYGFKTGDDKQFIHSSGMYKESKPFIRSAGVRRYWTEIPTEFVWYVPEKMIQNRKTARPGDKTRFESEKIIVSRMGKSLVADYDSGGLYVKDAMLLLSKRQTPSLKFLLGVINSRLLTYYYQKFFVTIDVLKNALLSLPIVTLDFSDLAEKAQHDKMVSLVEQMLALHKSLAAAKSPPEKERLERQIAVTDREIDRLVYELYGLTEEEIGIVEGQE
jgi:type I restriction-modification system DNA methylase subunit